jgi:hypothetical protein
MAEGLALDSKLVPNGCQVWVGGSALKDALSLRFDVRDSKTSKPIDEAPRATSDRLRDFTISLKNLLFSSSPQPAASMQVKAHLFLASLTQL